MPNYDKQFSYNAELSDMFQEKVKIEEAKAERSAVGVPSPLSAIRKAADQPADDIKDTVSFEESEPIASEATKLKVDPPLLNLREEPAGKVIAQLKRGDLLEVDDDTITKEGHEWCLVYSSSGLTGYVQRQFLSIPE